MGSFAELLAEPGVTEQVVLGSRFGFMAFHGGSLEVGTDAVAMAAASAAGASVYVVNAGGELTLRPVIVASFNEDDALITSGVSAGEKVVTLGVQKLEPGLKVRSIEAK